MLAQLHVERVRVGELDRIRRKQRREALLDPRARVDGGHPKTLARVVARGAGGLTGALYTRGTLTTEYVVVGVGGVLNRALIA
jgi:hypothetical protein